MMGANEVITTKTAADVVTNSHPEDVTSSAASDTHDSDTGKKAAPLLAKLFTVFLISCISFGSHWSTGVTGAMKSTIKKVISYYPQSRSGVGL
jgi:hypothetical protein